MIRTILAVAIATFVADWGSSFSHNALTGRPIFIGFVTGLLLGEVEQGILVSAQLELAFLGIVGIGGGAAADATTATIMTVAIAIRNHAPMETVIPLGVMIGYAASLLSSFKLTLHELLLPQIDSALKNDEERKFNILAIVGSLLCTTLPGIIINLIGILAGGPALEALVNRLPDFVMRGVGAAGSMLPSLGIAMIMTLIFSRRTAIYFFAGFVIYKYLKVDMVFMLVIGLLLAILDFNYGGKEKATEEEQETEVQA